MDADRLRYTAIIVGLVIGALLVVGGYVTGTDWVTLAGSVLGIGSGGVAAVRKVP